MQRSRVYGVGALVGASVLFVAREAVSGLIGEFVTKVVHPDILAGWTGAMSFTPADILILVLLLVGLFLLLFPRLQEWLRPEFERQQIRTHATNRAVFADMAFRDDKTALKLSQAFKPVFVDCSFRLKRIGILASDFTDFYRLEPKVVTVCTEEELTRLAGHFAVIKNANFVNSPIYCDHVFATRETFQQVLGRQPNDEALVPLDDALLVPPKPWWHRLTKRRD